MPNVVILNELKQRNATFVVLLRYFIEFDISGGGQLRRLKVYHTVCATSSAKNLVFGSI